MTKEEILERVSFDLVRAKEIYDWLNNPSINEVSQRDNENIVIRTSQPQTKIVSPYIDEKGGKFVHICAGDIDCYLAINDLSNKDMTKDDAKKLAEDNGMRLPKKRELSLTGAFIDEVNSLIKELGGSPLTDWYAAEENADCSADYSWYFSGTNGCISDSYRYAPDFRCRPVLASSNPSLKS